MFRRFWKRPVAPTELETQRNLMKEEWRIAVEIARKIEHHKQKAQRRLCS